MKSISDAQIRVGLRAVLTRHRIDVNRVTLTCSKGIVRLLGELHPQGMGVGTISPNELESLELEIAQVSGIERVYYDFRNWRRLECGQWKEMHPVVAGVRGGGDFALSEDDSQSLHEF